MLKWKYLRQLLTLNNISFIKVKSSVLIDPIFSDYIGILTNVGIEHNLDVIDIIIKLPCN